MNSTEPTLPSDIEIHPQIKVVIDYYKNRVKQLESFEVRNTQLEQQYRALQQDYLVAQAGVDYYKKLHKESMEDEDDHFEKLYIEEGRRRKQHEETISRLENTLKCLQLSQATTNKRYEDLSREYKFLTDNLDIEKETLLNQIRRLQEEVKNLQQYRHREDSVPRPIPGRDSMTRDSRWSMSSSNDIYCGSSGSYYTSQPPRSTTHLERGRHRRFEQDDNKVLDEWKSVSRHIMKHLGEAYVPKAKSYVLSEISRLTYLTINIQQVSWDEKSVQCYLCHKPFSFISRKHHCRYCGNAFCSQCIPRKIAQSNSVHSEPVKCCILCEQMISSVLK
ncbi:hypothetical protein WA158_001680 [Blastocystis sp. Blastoise]